METHDVIDRIARTAYGRLLAFLAARSRDVALAQDALGDAFHSALQTWPSTGVPKNPEAWILTAARRRLIDEARHAKVVRDSKIHLHRAAEEAQIVFDSNPIHDERLALLFTCAHPSIDPSVRTALMLQSVIGLDAAQIASAFLVSPASMSQRLVRAKNKIRDSDISFEVPGPDELTERLGSVLEAIYAAYNSDWESMTGDSLDDPSRTSMTQDALWLARVTVELLPHSPEPKGLLALMLYCESRRPARWDNTGQPIPLSDQNTRLWNWSMIQEAEDLLRAASEERQPGRYQIEAAIQSANTHRCNTGQNNWPVVVNLYNLLADLAPTAGVLVSRAAAIAQAFGPEAGLESLNNMEVATVCNYQSYWAVRAQFLSDLGSTQQAIEAYRRAIGLSSDPGTRRFLIAKLGGLT